MHSIRHPAPKAMHAKALFNDSGLAVDVSDISMHAPTPTKSANGVGFGKVLLLVLMITASPCFAEAASEAAVKVAFLYNFFKFIEWPETIAGPNHYTLCLTSHNDFGNNLLMLEGKTVNGKPLNVIQDIAVKDLKTCHMLYVSANDNPADYARELKGLPIVSVSDKSGFIEQGGIIGLLQDGNRLGFEINLNGADAGKLRFSAQLLKLAKNINANK